LAYVKWSNGWFWADADHKTAIFNTTASDQGIYINTIQGSGGGSTAALRIFAPIGVDRCDSTNITMSRGVWNKIEARFIWGAGGSVTAWVNDVQVTFSGCTGGIDLSSINLGTGLDGFKLDGTYNCFDAPGPTSCPDPNNFEFNADLESVWYDDVTICTGARCAPVSPPSPALLAWERLVWRGPA
jgi:hypothetical protein